MNLFPTPRAELWRRWVWAPKPHEGTSLSCWLALGRSPGVGDAQGVGMATLGLKEVWVWSSVVAQPPTSPLAAGSPSLGDHRGRADPLIHSCWRWRWLESLLRPLPHLRLTLFSLLLSPSWSVRRSEGPKGPSSMRTSKRWRRYQERPCSLPGAQHRWPNARGHSATYALQGASCVDGSPALGDPCSEPQGGREAGGPLSGRRPLCGL